MDILRKVDIIGNEVHGSRYRDASLFYPSVEMVSFNDSHYAEYDTVILAEPYLWNDIFAEQLTAEGFSGLLILEKMPFLSWEEFVRFSRKEYPFRTCHSMLRLFEDHVIGKEDNCLTVRWPNLIGDSMDKICHTLPNALLFFHKQLDLHADAVTEFIQTNDTLCVNMANDCFRVVLEIYDTANTTDCVQINGISVQWPNYIKLIHRLFDTVSTDQSDWRIGGAVIGEMIKVIDRLKLNES